MLARTFGLAFFTASAFGGATHAASVPASAPTVNGTALAGWADVQKAWLAVQMLPDSGVWDRLAEMTDTFGPRKIGSAGYANSLKWLSDQLRADGLNVTNPDVPNIPTWARGPESLTLKSQPNRPNYNIPVLALGSSIPTPKSGITAAVVPVTSLAELNTTDVHGKIVLVNYPWTGYGAASRIRALAAETAQGFGAKAVIIRSATPVSQRTPHTGLSRRANIPAAAISPEDANLLHRLYNRSLIDAHKYPAPVVSLNLASTYRNETTHNLFATLEGHTKPKEIVIIGGHLDSWDVGAGAADDAGNLFAAWESIRLIQKAGIKLKRSIRLTGWADEESGSSGAAEYTKYVQSETKKPDGERHVFAIEADFGIAAPTGFGVATDNEAGVKALPLFQAAGAADPFINAKGWGAVQGGDYAEVDVSFLDDIGVPVAAPTTAMTSDRYFAFHHSQGDTVDVVKRDELFANAQAIAFWAIVASELDVAWI
ncbi:hypothetical protein HDU87_000282 [Geranomyces variabilis]|uniref:Peptide hydrolase n=1 Tax=Geranomyces variabilis TaxID=109894 RepID=A0AAD5TSB2_9FUNG|nr:hypothetical protein HDU87_000282 [Geranomyces variabilis]